MGDGFFQIFFAGMFICLLAAGAVMFFQMEAESEDKRAVRAYMDSRGKMPIPRSWREKVGKGI